VVLACLDGGGGGGGEEGWQAMTRTPETPHQCLQPTRYFFCAQGLQMTTILLAYMLVLVVPVVSWVTSRVGPFLHFSLMAVLARENHKLCRNL
jgi:hypothetical protein